MGEVMRRDVSWMEEGRRNDKIARYDELLTIALAVLVVIALLVWAVIRYLGG